MKLTYESPALKKIFLNDSLNIPRIFIYLFELQQQQQQQQREISHANR